MEYRDGPGALFGTFSDWTTRDVDDVVAAARALNGQIVEHYTSWLIVASARYMVAMVGVDF